MNEKNIKALKPEASSILILPLVLVIAVSPLIIHLKIIPVDQAISDFWNSPRNNDFFSYYKSVLVVVGAVLAAAALLAGACSKRLSIKKSYLYIPVSLYAICIIFSTALSEYPRTALSGFPDRYEGAIVLLSYLVVFIAAMNLPDKASHIKLIAGSLLVSSAIIGTIGLLQYFGYDIFKSAPGKWLMLYPLHTGAENMVYGDKTGTIFATLYNPNSLGMYMSMLFPISLSGFLLVKGNAYKIIAGLSTCLMFANLIGSNSRGSYIGAFFAAVLIVVLMRKRAAKGWRSLAGIVLCLALIYFGMNYISGGSVFSRTGSILTGRDIHAEDGIIDKIKDFKINGSQLTLYCTNSLLKIGAADNRILFSDENGQALTLGSTGKDGEYTLKNGKYSGYTVTISGNLIKVQKGKSFLYFAITNTGFKFLNSKGRVLENADIEKLGFEGMERLGSGRGYIWSRTLPLLKHTLLYGHGPDTFAMYFPQNDYIGKLNFMYDANIIIDKPHNMYLQIAVNTGVVSLIAFLLIMGFYYFNSVKILLKSKFGDFSSIAGLSLFAAITGYVLSGFFTDSTVSVSPVFWVLLGLGIGLNYLKKQPAAKGEL